MDELFLTGMTLKEARVVLLQKGITNFKIVVTSPPRCECESADESFRVLMVYSNYSPIKILVCKP